MPSDQYPSFFATSRKYRAPTRKSTVGFGLLLHDLILGRVRLAREGWRCEQDGEAGGARLDERAVRCRVINLEIREAGRGLVSCTENID